METGKRCGRIHRILENTLKAERGQCGVATGVISLGLLLFLAAGSLAVYISQQMTAGVELQNAVDAAASAGATSLDGTMGGITAAVNRALVTNQPITVSGTTIKAKVYPPDVNVKQGLSYREYGLAKLSGTTSKAFSRDMSESNRRVILIPIFTNHESNNGRDKARSFDLGAFFLRTNVSNSSGDVKAEYIGGAYETADADYDKNFVAVTPINGGKVRDLAKSGSFVC